MSKIMNHQQEKEVIFNRAEGFKDNDKMFLHLETNLKGYPKHQNEINLFVGSPILALASITDLIIQISKQMDTDTLEVVKQIETMVKITRNWKVRYEKDNSDSKQERRSR